MTTIYIVSGGHGEYDDRRNWEICGYFEKSEAEEHVKKAQNRADRLLNDIDPWDKSEYDPFPDEQQLASKKINYSIKELTVYDLRLEFSVNRESK